MRFHLQVKKWELLCFCVDLTHGRGKGDYKSLEIIWSEWRLTVITATERIALVDILDLSEVDIPAGVFLHPAVGWG